MGQDNSIVSDDVPPETLQERSLEAVADYIRSGQVRRIVVLTGAGISTAAGIPDFRSPGTGLYAKLARLDLPRPEAVFDISYFRQNPKPFYVLAKELYPGAFHPTVSHAFIALLAEKGLLLHLFTQNIDCLERRAGIPVNRITEAHGSFATQHCIDCAADFPGGLLHEHVQRGEVPMCTKCGGIVKPDIVFFGEPLPLAFDDSMHLPSFADLVLILGTSLAVQPFAVLPSMARENVPRVLFNMERAGNLGSRPDDVLQLGDCDTGVRLLAQHLGWCDELEAKWRELVGNEEAERQLAMSRAPAPVRFENMSQLVGQVDEALGFDDKYEDYGLYSEEEDLVPAASTGWHEEHGAEAKDPYTP